jgi:hypothetical protein
MAAIIGGGMPKVKKAHAAPHLATDHDPGILVKDRARDTQDPTPPVERIP